MNILELDSYNLGDAVKFNTRLNPKIWGANETMLPEVRDRLLEIAQDFREFLGVTDLQLKDITVSGSNAAYTYTPHSDIDLHLVVDLPEADESEVYRELFDAKKYQYNQQHNIKIGGYDVELYVQNANEPHHSQGIYSVENNEWVDIPKRRKPTVDDISTRSKYEDLSQRIDAAIATDDFAVMTAMTNKIRDMRQAGLDAHGEFGPENLAFKMLRTQGKIKELYDARNAAKDAELSLKERRQPHSVFTYGFKHEEARPVVEQTTEVDTPAVSDEDILKDFIHFCVAELKIEQMPTIKLRRDPQWPVVHKTFGRYINDEKTLEVSFGQRHIMDVLRTVAHELTHKHQHEREGERMGPDAGETGSPYENEANAQAGILMRDYGRLHPELFDAGQAELAEGASGYIPTKAQAKDPRFSMALTVDIKPGQVGKEANKLGLRTDKQGHPQVARANGLFEELMLEFQLAKEGIQAPVNKAKDSEQYYKFIMAKHKLGRALTRQEQEFVRTYKMFGQQVAESVEQLDEVRMAPSNLQQWARSDAAKGIRAGFEAELIFRDTNSGDDDDSDMEPDYDMDERARSIDQVVEFFQTDDYGYGLSERNARKLQESLDEKYMEWMDEQMYDSWRDERDELIKEAWLREKPMAERIHAALVDGLDLDDAEADRIQAAGDKAPRFNSSKDQQEYEQQNSDYKMYAEAVEIAEEILDEDVEQTIAKEDGFYDEVLDDFRSDFYVDDDSGFFDDVGLRWMSDVANEYDIGWPYLTGGAGNGGSRDWESIGDSLNAAIDMPVKVSSGYHQATRREGVWIVEPDSSLEADDREDYGLEIVSPPMPLEQALQKLQQVTDWANNPREGDAYTNDSTGLHMGVSVPFKGGDVDYLKLILFLGDEYVLKSFGREANTYTKSAMSKFKENIKGGRADPAGAMKLMQSGLIELANREIQKGVGEGKYTSAHIQKGYIEFRSAGGDWLAEESADPEKLSSTMLRYAYAMSLAADPSAERREYAKKLYKLIAPEGDSQLALFSQYAAGELDAQQLKKRWAEKTIGAEKKMNQRFRLYQNVDGRWEPVPGAEWNGYPESEVKNKIWAKYGREALDSGEYQLVNMGEQDWEVYDVNTGKTLEIVKGKSKGEVADAVYDKYVDQGIGFNVRPYEDPATMTPRAKLAKAIVSKPAGPQVYTYYKWNTSNPKNGENSTDYMTRERVFQATKQVEKENPKIGKYTNTIIGNGSAELRTSEELRDIDKMTFDFRVKGSDEVIEQKTYDRATDSVDGYSSPVVIAIERANALAKQLGKPVVAYEVQPQQAEQPKPAQDTNERGVPYWEVFERETGHVVHTFLADTIHDATEDAKNWLTNIGAEQPNLFSVRPKMNASTPIKQPQGVGQVQDVAPDVAQNFSPQDATQRTGSWAIYDVTLGREISRMDDVAWQQASDRADELERSTGHNMSVRGLQENFADGKNPQDKGDSVRHGIPKGATIAQLEKAAKAPGRKGELARWQLNMRRGKKK